MRGAEFRPWVAKHPTIALGALLLVGLPLYIVLGMITTVKNSWNDWLFEVKTMWDFWLEGFDDYAK